MERGGGHIFRGREKARDCAPATFSAMLCGDQSAHPPGRTAGDGHAAKALAHRRSNAHTPCGRLSTVRPVVVAQSVTPWR